MHTRGRMVLEYKARFTMHFNSDPGEDEGDPNRRPEEADTDYPEGIEQLLGRSNAFVYSHDYRRNKFRYLSKGVERLLGYNHLAWKELGIDALRAAVHAEDRPCLREIQLKINALTAELPPVQRGDLSFTYSLRMQAAGGRTLFLSFNQVFVQFTDEGEPTADFVVVTDVSYLKRQPTCVLQVRIRDGAGDRVYRTVTFHTQPVIQFSAREIEVLRLVAEGLSSQEIADRLFITYNTVSTHRKKMMKKAGVKKALELVRYARQRDLI